MSENSHRTITGMVIKTAADVPLGGFEDKIFLKKCKMFQPPSDFDMKKVGPLVRKKNFSRFLQQDIALPEKFLEEKWFLFRKTFILLVSFLEVDQFFCRFAKFFSEVWQNTDSRA